jgi:hypothetical protein
VHHRSINVLKGGFTTSLQVQPSQLKLLGDRSDDDDGVCDGDVCEMVERRG